MSALKNRVHLVPDIIVDCAEKLASAKHDHMRDAYAARLEAIRDYCDQVLKNKPSNHVFERKRKSVDPNDARKWSS